MRPTGQITRLTKVREAEQMLTIPTLVAREDEGLLEMAKKVVEAPGCRTMAVLDTSDKLVGVIPVSLLVNDIFFGIVPEEFLISIKDYHSAMDFADKVAARIAKHIMQAPVSVKMSDTVEEAFRRMYRKQLGGLPIVDDENHVIGYLDMLELLLVWIETKGNGEE